MNATMDAGYAPPAVLQHQEVEPLEEYMVSIDSLEKISGIELFEGLYGTWENE